MRRILLVLLTALLAGACSSDSAPIETAAPDVQDVRVEPVAASTTETTAVTQGEASTPEGLAATEDVEWLSFSFDTGYEVDGLLERSGLLNISGDMIILTPSEYPHHMLSLHLDDEGWVIQETEWGLFWQEPESDFLGDDAAAIRSLFAPIFEEGAFSGDRQIDINGETMTATFAIGPPNGTRPVVTVVAPDVSPLKFEVVLLAPNNTIAMPDPRTGEVDAIGITREALVGDDVNPIVKAWYEAYQVQQSR